MLRVASSALIKRGLYRSSQGARSWAVTAPSVSSIHSSVPRKEEEKSGSDVAAVDAPPSSDSNMALFAIPVGIACAVPVLQFQWYIPNEETLLASTFVGAAVIAYTQFGGMLSDMFKAEANDMLKAQNEAEDKVIDNLENTVVQFELTENIVDDYQSLMDLTETSYKKLNDSGKIKPKHMLKSQLEKMMVVLKHEEQNNYEKLKKAMMTEATETVKGKFGSDKALKKTALTAAIGQLKNLDKKKAAGATDPVEKEFLQFFANKKTSAAASDDGTEELEARRGVLTKMNTIAENEAMYFRFDLTTGMPKLIV